MLPLIRVVAVAYQRGRFMSPARLSVVPLRVEKMLASLLPRLLVTPGGSIQLSPPSRRTSPVDGRMIGALQNRSVPVWLGKVQCGEAVALVRPSAGFQRS